jgi:RNA polymerase sigma-70 factor (ECF subfamily)
VSLLASCDDRELAAGLRAGRPGAALLLFDRYAPCVQRVLSRVLGLDPEIPDLIQEVFLSALQGMHTLRAGQPVKAWLVGIAVFTARKTIRRRVRRRWLAFFLPQRDHDVRAPDAPAQARAALEATYAVLERMPEKERVAFALRHIEGMELKEVAAACGVSLATIKRTLDGAQARFRALARHEPELERWLEGGGP